MDFVSVILAVRVVKILEPSGMDDLSEMVKRLHGSLSWESGRCNHRSLRIIEFSLDGSNDLFEGTSPFQVWRVGSCEK